MKILVVLSAATAACLAAPGFLPGAAVAPLDAFRCAGLPCSVPAVSYAAAAPAAFPAVAAPVALTSQFHAQDELGQYSYGYQGGPSAKAESRALDGSVSGGYSYVDANGVLQTAQYVSDPVNGFRVASTATARPVEDTPEVMQARAAHAAFVADAAARSAAIAAATPAPETRDQQQATGPSAAPAAPAAPTTGTAAGRSAAAPPPAATSYANIVIGPSGVPLDTPEVAAARAADAVAHLQAKAAALFG